MPELMMEIFSEEIPARMQNRAADDLLQLMSDGLRAAGLDFVNPRSHATPRRLVFVAEDIPEHTPIVLEDRRGPRVDAPDQAIAGFRNGLPEGAAIMERETPKGTFMFAQVEKSGEASTAVLGKMAGRILERFPWPKSMRWGNGALRWVRPIHRASFLFNGNVTVLHGGGNAAPVAESDDQGFITYGHRFLSPGPIRATGFADYEAKLRASCVLVDREQRKQTIRQEAEALAKQAGLKCREDPDLLEEIAGLVEWPVVLMGTIDDRFMTLPPEVLVTTMRIHQKYFVCEDADGHLANRFVMTANMTGCDDTIIAGNERVLRARLADARFFWDVDRRVSLASRAPTLKERVFHARLGTLDDKADRMQALATALAAFVPGADRDKVRSAARLAKCDLSTGMVGEFPELQGTMGRYYALNDDESTEVADAIAEHYAPAGPADTCPVLPVSICVALADKIDSLVGFFGIGEKPTGSKDPFALRRAALGVIRLIVENRLRLPLATCLTSATALYEGAFDVRDDTFGLLAFFADRLKVHLREQGVRHDLVDAVFVAGDEDDLVRLLVRVGALAQFLETDDGANLLVAYRRAANILRIEEKKEGRSYVGVIDATCLVERAECDLHAGIERAAPAVAAALAEENYGTTMKQIATLRPLVDRFFDDVTVNADDEALRENRLNILAAIRRTLDPIADFSRIEGRR